MKVVVAGASGFVGKHLIERLLKNTDLEIRALGRSLNNAKIGALETMHCDLFSLLDVEKALEGQDIAIYLVHSMLPSSQLSQGSFEDYDLIIADNFARAARKKNIKKVIYLGGIIPEGKDSHPEELSLHLRSRLEVEEIFKSYKIPLLALRAGMVMGKEGSSFQMLLRLVQRLPFMLCPAWTRSRSSPIHVVDVAESFAYVLQQETLLGAYDLDNGQSISYLEMLERCAEKLHKKRFFLDVKYFSPKLSKFWVSLITGAPKDLVYPLVESLLYDMSPNPAQTLRIPDWKYVTYDEALNEVLLELDENADRLSEPKAYKSSISEEHLRVVQSVQRHHLPPGKSAEWASQEYIKWLNANFKGLITVETQGNTTKFYLAGSHKALLELSVSKERSSDDRILFYITGGLLARETKRGRLEFRVTPDGKNLITAIHDYRPRLPWYLYKYSQAIMHASVMKRFGEYLQKKHPLALEQKT
ncbi:MAG: NAD(P)H-binding protein [Bdellovibrionota bacterium]